MLIKYYLIYLKYYNYLFYEVFIFTCNIFLISRIPINYSDFSFHKSLAFNINILYTLKNTENCFCTEKIYLSQLNLQKINIKQYSKINIYINKLLKYYNYIILKKSLNEMKLSGLISSVNSIKVLIKNQRYFKLYIQVNKIVKVINIYDGNSLIISYSKLENILKKQLGFPKNYKTLYESIQKIYLWYKIQGFEWISIQIIDDNNSQNINIKIVEKKVISSNIICKNSHKTRSNILTFNAITSEMKKINGNILNKYKLNTIIKIIQKKYLLKDISYKIINQQEGLHINLIYRIHDNKFIDICYSPNSLYYLHSSYRNFLTQFFINFSKIYQIFIYKYSIKYLLKLTINIEYFYMINIKVNFINNTIHQYIQSFHKKLYHYKQNKYNFNLFWLNYTLINFRQRIFILYLFNFEIYNKYYLNQSLQSIQQINNIIYKYHTFFVQIQYNINSMQGLISKYKKHIFSNFFYYKINLRNSYSQSYSGNINRFNLKLNQYLFLYFNTYSNINYEFIHLYSYFLNFDLNNKLHLNIQSHLFNIEIQYNIINTIIHKLIFLKTLLMNSCNLNKNFSRPLFYFYVNYSFYINKYNQLYIFNNYIYDINLPTNKYNLILGCGLQVNIPFKQIPRIRLEYIINMKNFFYLFIDKYSI